MVSCGEAREQARAGRGAEAPPPPAGRRLLAALSASPSPPSSLSRVNHLCSTMLQTHQHCSARAALRSASHVEVGAPTRALACRRWLLAARLAGACGKRVGALLAGGWRLQGLGSVVRVGAGSGVCARALAGRPATCACAP